MKDHRIFVNPFRMLSPKLDAEAPKFREVHELPISESYSAQEGMLVMASKLIEMNKILSKCIVFSDPAQISACEALAEEVHKQEKLITSNLVADSKSLEPKLFKIIVRFPFRLQRIGDMLESILSCCKIKQRDGIPFSDKAYNDLTQIFDIVHEMLVNMRDALIIRNKALIQHMLTQRQHLHQLLLNARFAHWDRLEAGYCAVQASSLFLDVLDSFGAINEYLGKIAQGLLDIEEPGSEEKDV